LRNTVGGSSDDEGIYLTDGIETVKVARKGETLMGLPITGLSLSADSSHTNEGSGGEDSRGTSLNEYGQVAFLARSGAAQGVFLYTHEQIRWRSSESGQWDALHNWTLSLKPGAPHHVAINPDSNLSVLGPVGAARVRSLDIGGGAGVATLVLQPASSISSAEGVTVHSGGQLLGAGTIVGNVLNNGMVAPGPSTGVFHIEGNFTQTVAGKLQIELDSVTNSDMLQVMGNLSLAGGLEVSLANGYLPAANASFDVLDWGSLSGIFSTLQLPPLAEGLAWDTTGLYVSGVLRVAGASSADFNGDNKVDGADLAEWKSGFGTAAQDHGDADRDGDVDGMDFLAWQRQLGSSLVISVSNSAPEPPTAFLIMATTIGLCFWRP
jgi:hypothetical protein